MKLLFILIILIQKLNFIFSLSTIDLFVQHVFQELNPHHVTAYAPYTSRNASSKTQIVLNELMKQVPVTIIGHEYASNLEKIESSQFLTYNHKISSTLHLILLDFDNSIASRKNTFDELQEIFNLIDTSICYMSRPKYLLISNSNAYSNKDIRKFLSLAWKHYLLDFTVAFIDHKGEIKIVIHNPYFGSTEITEFRNSNIELFPDKLNNINGFKLKVGVSSICWPECDLNFMGTANKNKWNNLYTGYKYFEKTVNSSTEIIPYVSSASNRLDTIKQNNLSLFFSYNFVNQMNHYKNSKLLGIEKFVAIVPVSHIKRFEFSAEILYCFLGILSIFIRSAIILKRLKLLHEDWSALLVFQLVLGFAAEIKHKSLQSKILYFTIVCFSIFFASDIILEVAKSKYVSIERPLIYNFEEVFEKNITIYSPMATKAKKMLLENNYVNENLKIIINNIKKCNRFEDLSKFKNSIRIVSSTIADAMLEKRSDHSKKYTIIDTNLTGYITALLFENNSPYLIKYSKIVDRISETGLDKKWVREVTEKKNFHQEDDTALIYLLKIIMITGTCLSTIVYVYEVLRYLFLIREIIV